MELDLSFSEDDSLDDARMMRSMQLATINLTPQELIHHSLWSANVEINETLPIDSVRLPTSIDRQDVRLLNLSCHLFAGNIGAVILSASLLEFGP